jgi:hypothetical protein
MQQRVRHTPVMCEAWQHQDPYEDAAAEREEDFVLKARRGEGHRTRRQQQHKRVCYPVHARRNAPAAVVSFASGQCAQTSAADEGTDPPPGSHAA